MNERIRKHAKKAGFSLDSTGIYTAKLEHLPITENMEKFAKLLIEDVLNEVKERAYYTGDRDWSDQVDRPWIQLEFGYGKLHDAKQSGVK